MTYRSIKIRNNLTGQEATTDRSTWERYVAAGKKDPQWDEIRSTHESTEPSPTVVDQKQEGH